MKKILVLLASLFMVSLSLYSQALNYEIKVKNHKSASGEVGDITIVIKDGEPAFTFILMTNDPIKGEIILKSEPVSAKSYTFKDIKPGKYFVKIIDQNGLPAGKTVEILKNDN